MSTVFAAADAARPPHSDPSQTIYIVLAVLLAYLASLFGFGSLIGTIYPLFGYASALFLVLMLLHAVLLFR